MCLVRTKIDLPEFLAFRSQGSIENMAQPDLIGSDEHGNRNLIVEIKFWAGLTENQPITYLKALPSGTPGILLVICPAQRIEVLWEKLVTKVAESSLNHGATTRMESGFLYCPVNDQHHMVALSWRQLLGVLRREAETANDYTFLSDTTQLQGLCDRMDSQAFLPLHPDHIGSDVGMRIQHFANIVDELVAEMRMNHDADTTGLSTGGGQSTYVRFFRLGVFGLGFQYSPRYWSQYGDTPFWLKLDFLSGPAGWSEASWISKGLDKLPSGKYYRIPYGDEGNIVGLNVPTGVEHEGVLNALIEQVKEVVTIVASAQPEPTDSDC